MKDRTTQLAVESRISICTVRSDFRGMLQY